MYCKMQQWSMMMPYSAWFKTFSTFVFPQCLEIKWYSPLARRFHDICTKLIKHGYSLPPGPISTINKSNSWWHLKMYISHNEIGSSSHRVNEGNLFPMLALCGSVFFPFQSLKIYVLLTWLKWGCWQRHCLARLEAVSFDLILQEGK